MGRTANDNNKTDRTYAANCRRGILPRTNCGEMYKSISGTPCPALKCVTPNRISSLKLNEENP